MEIWIYFVLISQLIWAFCSLIDKFVISKGHIKNPLVYIVLNGIMNILLVFLLPFIKLNFISFFDFMIALLSGITVTAGIILYYKAVQYEEISRIIILFQFIPIFTLLLSFLVLGERLSRNDFIGFALLFAAGLIVSYHKEQSFKIGKAFYLMLLSGFLVGIAYVAAKHIFNVTDFWSGVFWLRFVGFIALAVLIVPSVRRDFMETFREMGNKIRYLLGFKMIIDFSAFIISDFAILLGPVSLISALSSASAPIFVFILALLTSVYIPNFVKEDIAKTTIFTKVLAIILIIVGIIFISL